MEGVGGKQAYLNCHNDSKVVSFALRSANTRSVNLLAVTGVVSLRGRETTKSSRRLDTKSKSTIGGFNKGDVSWYS